MTAKGPGPARVLAPFFRAPAACWWARMEVESTENTHSTSPAASSLTTASSRILTQVPSMVQIRSRSWPVFHGPYRSGTSRQGAPVRSFHRIPLTTRALIRGAS